VYDAVPDLFEADTIVLVTGRIDRRGRELQIRGSEVKAPSLLAGADDVGAAPPSSLLVELPASACTPSVLGKLRQLLEAAPGEVPVRVRFVSSQGVQPLELGRFRVDPRGSLLDELRSLLGPMAARLDRPEASSPTAAGVP